MNDIYQLVINPDDDELYRIDAKWKKFEIEKVRLKVKIFLGIKVPVKEKFCGQTLDQ